MEDRMTTALPSIGEATIGRPTLSEVAELIGGTSAATHMAVFESGASLAEIRTALAYWDGVDDALGDLPPPLEGKARVVYDILRAAEVDPEDDAAEG
jgi:hypothetical protein